MTATKRTSGAARRRGIGLERIVSGGQTGVDRAALDVALELGLPCGGWCPRGRKAEDGPIPERYPLRETSGRKYAERTERNVCESHGTLILTIGAPAGGTALTKACAERLGKPCLVIDLAEDDDVGRVVEWLRTEAIRVLNVAGPRRSQQAAIYERAQEFLRRLFTGAGGAKNQGVTGGRREPGG